MDYSFLQNKISGGIGGDDHYWMGLEEGKFQLPRCSGCERWMWPANFRCGHCGSWDSHWVEVEPKGRVYGWTRNWMAFERVQERADEVPYVVVLAELPEAGGARVLGMLKGSADGIKCGAAVRGEIDPPSPRSKEYASIRWVLETGE